MSAPHRALSAAAPLRMLAHPPHQLLAHCVGGLEAEGGGDVGRLEVDGGRQAGAVEELHREDVARAEALVGQRGEADEPYGENAPDVGERGRG